MEYYMKIFLFFLFFFCFSTERIYSAPIPIQFSISEKKIIKSLSSKSQDFAKIIPGDLKTYVFESEQDYYNDYQKSFYAVTKLKGGWDCMRHYEILANGCIPYFVGLDDCDSSTLFKFPRDLVKRAMNLPGVSYLGIDHSVFDQTKYYEILKELMIYTKEHLSSESIAKYFLDQIGFENGDSILYLSGDLSPDYLRCLMLIGLKNVIGNEVVDFPIVEHIYSSTQCDIKKLYGKGFSYTKIVEIPPLRKSPSELVKEIQNRKYTFVVYGSIHRGVPFIELVRKNYPKNKIFFLCGEDIHTCKYKDLKNLFLREFSGNNLE